MSTDKPQIRRYELVVIGSSPVALAYAIRNAEGGVRTLILESRSNIGGAWQMEEMDCGARIEIACHLFEYWTDGYEVLANLSTVPFDLQVAQPFKRLPDGTERPYSTRATIIGQLMYSLAGYIAVTTVKHINSSLPGNIQLLRGRSLDKLAWREQLGLQLRYRFSKLFRFDGIRFPRGGVDRFVSGLADRFRSLGGDIATGSRVQSLDKVEDKWILRTSTGSEVESMRVAVSESADVRAILGSYLDGHLAPVYTIYWHALVSVPRKNVRRPISYIHLPGNPTYHRVTIIDVPRLPADRSFYLVQTRIAFDEFGDFRKSVANLLSDIGVIDSADELTLESQSERRFVQSRRDAPLAKSDGLDGIEIFPSIGDVARNIRINLGDGSRT